MVPAAEFQSYYGKPILKAPTWAPLDIAGYLFLGGLAGASSVVGAGAQATGRPALARATKTAALTAAVLSLTALVHDLGRPARFLNMLRTFKWTSPMSVGSWLLSAYAPAAIGAALSDLTGIAPAMGTAATVAAAITGPGVATYTGALIGDTAVPAWHAGHRYLPFVFAASAASAAAGVGLVGAPLGETAPVRRLAVLAGTTELVTDRRMRAAMGIPAEAFEAGRAKRYHRASQILTGIGITAAAAGRRSRAASALAGAALLGGSAFTRFAIFEAGRISTADPRYTVVPQRRRLASG